jgi:hypothetical protein
MGYEQVASVTGGTAAWREAGRPVEFGDTSVAKPRVSESEWTHAGVLSYSI